MGLGLRSYGSYECRASGRDLRSCGVEKRTHMATCNDAAWVRARSSVASANIPTTALSDDDADYDGKDSVSSAKYRQQG